MKRIGARRVLLTGVLSLALLAGGCASSEKSSEPTSGDGYEPNTVTSEEIEKDPASSVQEMLQGRVAGVVVTRRAGGISVRIRGATSIRGSNEPLYVVDGTPVTPGPAGFLRLNPYDIESIEVLKGSRAAFYGVRGANGVIVIKTKQGGGR